MMLATDPDADRVGIAMKCPDGSYELVSGNEVGVLLLDYICSRTYRERYDAKESGSSEIYRINTTCRCSCRALWVELRSVLTGFKWIGDQIARS